MDVYIKGMKMPKSCDECRIMVFEDTNCVSELFCGCPIVFKAHPQGVEHRPDYCPLVELPPHGRLIDADNLLTNKSISIIGKGMIFGGQYVFSESEIVNAPTIIPAENDSQSTTNKTIKIVPSQYQIVKQIDLTKDSIERIADAVVRKLKTEEGE